MINSVPDSQKASANSIANLCYNLFGFLPAPLIYGIIDTFTATAGPPGTPNKSRYAMGALLYSTIPTIACLLWGITRKIKIQNELRSVSLAGQDIKKVYHGDEKGAGLLNQTGEFTDTSMTDGFGTESSQSRP